MMRNTLLNFLSLRPYFFLHADIPYLLFANHEKVRFIFLTAAARLLCLVQRQLFVDSSCYTRSLVHAIQVSPSAPALRQVQADELGPIQHGDEIGVGDRETIQKINPCRRDDRSNKRSAGSAFSRA